MRIHTKETKIKAIQLLLNPHFSSEVEMTIEELQEYLDFNSKEIIDSEYEKWIQITNNSRIKILGDKIIEFNKTSKLNKAANKSYGFKLGELILFCTNPEMIIKRYFDPNEEELSEENILIHFQKQIEEECK